MRFPALSFNAGELSPQIDARSDVEKYRAGCRTLENMIPRIYGPATRRPGTKYIDTCGGVGRLIPFIYSNTISYMVLLEDEKMYFYYDGAELLDGNEDRVYVDTPYSEDDLFEIQYKQANDVMWLVHPDYPPYKLTRTSATAFSLDAITFANGPFKKRNDLENDDDVTMTPSVITGTGTLTSSASYFTSNHVGALFSVTQPRVLTDVEVEKITEEEFNADNDVGITDWLPVDGSFTFTTHGLWTGEVSLERSIDGGTTSEVYHKWTSEADFNVSYTGEELEDGIYYRIRVLSLSGNPANVTAGPGGGCEFRGKLVINSSTQTGICRVTTYTSATVVSVTVLKDFASTDGDVRWAEGSWSDDAGYPATVTFFEDRVVYGGSSDQPQTVWASATDDYENFASGVNPDDAFYVTISSDQRNAIQWISSLESLIIGTTGGEWRLRSSAYDEPLTPTNISCKQQTTYGSKSIQALPVNDVILFVDYVGRKVREVTFTGDKDKYIARDLTALAEHVTDGGITTIAYQKSPDPILWCVTGDGVLLSMTYEREQDVIAWSRHPMRSGDTVESVAVIPGSTEDEVWMICQRSIGGSDVRYVEQMQPRYVADQEDQWFVDCAAEYDSTATTTMDGLDHLEGEEVTVLADGAAVPAQTVDGGEITLDDSASRIIAGLPYRYQLKPMRFDLQMDGTTKGSLKKIPEVVVSFYKTLNAEYGIDTDNLFNIDWRTEETYGTPPALFTGDKVVAHEGGFDVDDSFVITDDGPFPCTVRAIVPRIESIGR